jgi:hypothetical protein
MPLYQHTSTGEIRDLPPELILTWTAANNPKLAFWAAYTPPEPEPYVAPVPSEVGSGQIRAALVAEGWVTITTPSTPDPEIDAWVSALIEAAVANPGQKAIAYLLWHNASVFKRSDQFVLMVAALTGKTSEQIDQLFTTANTF